MIAEPKRKRRVIPGGKIIEPFNLEKLIEEFAELTVVHLVILHIHQMRNQHDDTGCRRLALQQRFTGAKDRLFEIEHFGAPGSPRQEMLRPLINKIPPQMGKTHERGAATEAVVNLYEHDDPLCTVARRCPQYRSILFAHSQDARPTARRQLFALAMFIWNSARSRPLGAQTRPPQARSFHARR